MKTLHIVLLLFILAIVVSLIALLSDDSETAEVRAPVLLVDTAPAPPAEPLVGSAVAASPLEARAGASASATLVATESIAEDEPVALPAPATVSGVVLGPEGQPVAGADVLGWCTDSPRFGQAGGDDPPERQTTTDSQGRFTVEQLGPAFLLSAQAPGMVCRWLAKGKVPPGAVVEGLVLELDVALTLSGRVIDQAGQPVAGVELVASSWGAIWSSDGRYSTGVEGVSRSDPISVRGGAGPDGFFALGPVASTGYHLAINQEPWLPFGLGCRAEDSPLEVRLERGVSLSGTVMNVDGAPLAGAEVSLRVSLLAPAVPGQGTYRTTVTDGEGGFLLEGLLPSIPAEEPSSGGLFSGVAAMFGGASEPKATTESALMIAASGHAIQVLQPVDIPDDSQGHVDVWLEPEQVLAGQVVDAQGTPLADAPMSLIGDRMVTYADTSFGRPTTWEWLLGVDETITDAEGRFRFEQLYDGLFEVRVRDPENRDLTMVVKERSGNESVLIRLDSQAMRSVVLQGRVLDALTGEPIEHFNATPMRRTERGFSGSGREVHDVEGRYELTGLDPGELYLSITAPGYAPWQSPTEFFEVGDHVFDVDLIPGRRLQLRVVDETGAPVPGANLVFLDDRDELLDVTQGSVRLNLVNAGSNGEVEVSGLPAGPVWVLANTKNSPLGLSADSRQLFNLSAPLPGVHQLVVASPPPTRQVTLVVLGSAMPHADEFMSDSGTRMTSLAQAMADPSRWPLGASLEARVLHLGTQVAKGSLRSLEDGSYEFSAQAGATSSTGKPPWPLMGLSLWELPLEIELTAQGYAPRTLKLPSGPEELAMIVTMVQGS
ncbi:MAG: protocatechuate 3,4-dioxygenase beta subunit [Pseudohongiellaceae bacterium]|jgi:protocatechuate 3,4-dioxygenase beta subunit